MSAVRHGKRIRRSSEYLFEKLQSRLWIIPGRQIWRSRTGPLGARRMTRCHLRRHKRGRGSSFESLLQLLRACPIHRHGRVHTFAHANPPPDRSFQRKTGSTASKVTGVILKRGESKWEGTRFLRCANRGPDVPLQFGAKPAVAVLGFVNAERNNPASPQKLRVEYPTADRLAHMHLHPKSPHRIINQAVN